MPVTWRAESRAAGPPGLGSDTEMLAAWSVRAQAWPGLKASTTVSSES